MHICHEVPQSCILTYTDMVVSQNTQKHNMQYVSGIDIIAQRTPNSPDYFTASLVVFLCVLTYNHFTRHKYT